jgi:hypothetical protein
MATMLQTHSVANSATWINDVLKLMRLVLHRLGFVVFDTEDSRVVYLQSHAR